ncbi:MAG: O-antigen ligase family protein [Gemmatimonas sp.]
MSDAGAVFGNRAGQVAASLILTVLALSAGLVFFYLSSSKPAFFALSVLMLAGLTVLLQLRDITLGILCALVLVAPIAVSKALALGAGVYAPALELTLADVCLIALVPFWVTSKATRGQSLFSGLRAWPAVSLFFLWAWVSALHADVPAHGVLAAINLSKSLLVFLVVSDLVNTPQRMRWVLIAAAVGLALQATMAGAQFVTKSLILLPGMKTSESATMGISMRYVGGGQSVSAFRPFGLSQHPVFLATYLVMVLPVVLAVVLAGKKAFGSTAWRVSIALLLAGGCSLVVTLSRGGWIAFALAALFIFVAGVRYGVVRRVQLVAAGALAVFAAMATLVVYPTVYYRLTQSDDRSSESRWLMIKQAGSIIQESPVIGVGLATYTREAKRVMPPAFSAYSAEFRKTIASGVVHNAYLVFWAERGLVGLISVFLVFGTFFRRARRVVEWQTPAERALALGLAGGLFGQLAMYNFDHAYLDSRPGILWVLFALFAALLQLQRRPQRAAGVQSSASFAVIADWRDWGRPVVPAHGARMYHS